MNRIMKVALATVLCVFCVNELSAKELVLNFDCTNSDAAAKGITIDDKTGTVTVTTDGQSSVLKVHGESVRAIPELHLRKGADGLNIGNEDEILESQYLVLQKELPNISEIEIEAYSNSEEVTVVAGTGARSGKLKVRFRSSNGSDRDRVETDAADSCTFEAEEAINGYPVIKFWSPDTAYVRIVSIKYIYE